MTTQDLIKRWNDQHAPGTHVYYCKGGKKRLQSTTKSQAMFDRENNQAVIRLDGFGIVPLEALQVAEVRTK
jgi:hypothetical protein